MSSYFICIRGWCSRSERWQVTLPLSDDLLMMFHLEIGQVLCLGILYQLSFVLFEFLLIFSRQVLHSLLHDVAWGDLGVILWTWHLWSQLTISSGVVKKCVGSDLGPNIRGVPPGGPPCVSADGLQHGAGWSVTSPQERIFSASHRMICA
jgi:hypothetical protein